MRYSLLAGGLALWAAGLAQANAAAPLPNSGFYSGYGMVMASTCPNTVGAGSYVSGQYIVSVGKTLAVTATQQLSSAFGPILSTYKLSQTAGTILQPSGTFIFSQTAYSGVFASYKGSFTATVYPVDANDFFYYAKIVVSLSASASCSQTFLYSLTQNG